MTDRLTLTRAYWFTQHEGGSFPVHHAALGEADLSVMHIGERRFSTDPADARNRFGYQAADAVDCSGPSATSLPQTSQPGRARRANTTDISCRLRA